MISFSAFYYLIIIKGLLMYIKEKLLLRAILSLMTVIILSTAMFSIIVARVWLAGNTYFTAAAIALLLPVAFFISKFFYRIYTRPLIRIMHRTEKNTLLKTHEQFAGFMDDLPLGVFIKDEQSRSVYLNKYMDKIL